MTQKKLLVIFLTLLLALLFPVFPLLAAADEADAQTLKRLQEENKKTEELLEKYKNTKLEKYNQAVVFVHDETGKPVDITLRIYYSDQVQERITTAKGRFNNVFNHGTTIPETVLSLAIEKHPEDQTCQILAIKIQGPKLMALAEYSKKLKILLENEIKNKAAEQTAKKVIEKVLSSLDWTAEKINIFIAAFSVGKDLAAPINDYLTEKFAEIIQAAKEQNALVQKVLVEETNPAYEEMAHGGWSGPFRENVGIEKVSLVDRIFPRYHKPITQFKYDISLRCRKAKPPEQLKWHDTSYYFRIRQGNETIIDIDLKPEESADEQALSPPAIERDDLKSAVAETFSRAGLTPDSRWYFIDNLMEKIDLALTFKLENKIKKIWQQAEEKLAEMEEMAIKNLPTAFNLAGEKYQERLKRINQELIKARSGQSEKNFLDLMETKTAAHQSILISISDHINELVKPTVEKMMAKLVESSAKGFKGLLGDSPTVRYEDTPAAGTSTPAAKPKPIKEPAQKDPVNKTTPEKPKATAPPPPETTETPATIKEETEEEICGDGRLTFSETCDGNQFSQPCLDSLADYKKIYNNPNLTLRCFNNCRGCELATPARE